MSGQLPTILVVDDEDMIRESLQLFLEGQGYLVAAAASAEEALELLCGQPFDAAVVDIRLPGMSGDEMILQAHARCPGVRFLIFTGSVNFHIGPELTRIGMTPQDIFAKPLGDMQTLVDRLRRLLA